MDALIAHLKARMILNELPAERAWRLCWEANERCRDAFKIGWSWLWS